MQFHIFIIELQYQYLNYITGIPVLYKILKKIQSLLPIGQVVCEKYIEMFTTDNGSPVLGDH
jgi:hypothetical protein